jgi:uncharacterized protein YkwD
MKRLWIFATLLVLTFILTLPQKADAQPRQFSANLSASDVINEVNALRSSNGLAPYTVNSVLMVIAQRQADYMASTQTVTHYGAGGSRPYQRALDAGYPLAGDLSLGGFFSENIISGLNLSASDAVVKWQGDADHLSTMLSPDLTEVGAGVTVVDNVYYYVLDAAASTNSAPANSGSTPGSVTQTPLAGNNSSTQAPAVITSTPLENGTVYHIVQANEALWSIALAYNISVDDLKKLNSLTSNDIFIGQKLIIVAPKRVGTATPTAPEPTITVTLGIPTSTATHPVTPTFTSTATPVPSAPVSRQSSEVVVGAIIAAALLAAGLGAWLGRKKSD